MGVSALRIAIVHYIMFYRNDIIPIYQWFRVHQNDSSNTKTARAVQAT